MLCLKVPKSEGEKVRNKLLERNLLEKEARISSDKDYIYIPIKNKPEDISYPIIEKEVRYREQSRTDYRELIELPTGLKEDLPSSFDIIGDIAVIKIPESLKGYGEKIGKAILSVHKNLTTVLKDEGVDGEFRVRKVKKIAGIDKTKTIHKEYGAEFEIDLDQVYFSPRLATERWRVVQETKPGEEVFDMFAGVGPYSILIAKNKNVKKVHSVDINPEAVKLLKDNIKRNHVEDIIKIYNADARNISKSIKAERIIMNLPHSSFDFIESAIEAIKNNGVIHYYEILEENILENRLTQLKEKIKKNGFMPTIKHSRCVRTYSASMSHMAYDIYVERKQ